MHAAARTAKAWQFPGMRLMVLLYPTATNMCASPREAKLTWAFGELQAEALAAGESISTWKESWKLCSVGGTGVAGGRSWAVGGWVALPSSCIWLCWMAQLSRTHGWAGQGRAVWSWRPALLWCHWDRDWQPQGGGRQRCWQPHWYAQPVLSVPGGRASAVPFSWLPLLPSWAAYTHCSSSQCSLLLCIVLAQWLSKENLLTVIFWKEESFSIASQEISPWLLNTGGHSALWHPNEILLEHHAIRGISTFLALLEIPQYFGLSLPFLSLYCGGGSQSFWDCWVCPDASLFSHSQFSTTSF